MIESPAAWHGRGVNWPQRALKGYHWKASEGLLRQPRGILAMLFAEADVCDGDDCSFSYAVESGLKSGIYAVSIQHGKWNIMCRSW